MQTADQRPAIYRAPASAGTLQPASAGRASAENHIYFC